MVSLLLTAPPPPAPEVTDRVGRHLGRCWEQKSGSADGGRGGKKEQLPLGLQRITWPQPKGDQADYSRTCLKGALFLAEAFVLDSEWEELSVSWAN